MQFQPSRQSIQFARSVSFAAAYNSNLQKNFLLKLVSLVNMASVPIRTVISQDFTKKAWEQAHYSMHNRWHPDIPAVVAVKPGEIFRVECFDWSGGQIKNDDEANDIRDADLSRCHSLSGPIAVEGAEPGDYLEVEVLDAQPIPGWEWGYSGIFDVNNGGSFLHDLFPSSAKAVWDFEGIYAKSRHIRFPGLIHPGVIGTAPSQELLVAWNERESAQASTNPSRVPPLAFLPDDKGSVMGALEATPELAREKGKEAARTVPPRENGGNVDIKNISRGSKIWLSVYVQGANLSVGDIHFSEGDGEISMCGGIEMHGAVTLKVNLIKNGVALHGNLTMPMFMPGPIDPHFSRYLGFEGISVNDQGKQHFQDATLSFRQACLNAIRYLKRFGYSAEQAYMILSAAPVEGRINAIVDVPNACCSISVPPEIFEFDISPVEGGHAKVIGSNCPIAKSDGASGGCSFS